MRKLFSRRCLIRADCTLVRTSVQLYSHTNSTWMLAMRQESYSACNYWWVKFLFVSHVGICISLEHIVTTYICVEMPGTCNVKAEYQYPGISRPVLACLTGTLAPVFNLVGLSKLLTLPSAKPAHCFCSRDPVVSVKIDLQPLPHSMRDGLSRAPCTTLHILSGPNKNYLKLLHSINY